jgi:heat shock protein HtpX
VRGLPLSWTTAPIGGRTRLHITTELLDRVGDRELEAVVAHELGHLANRDAVLMTALAGPPAWVFGGLRVMWDDDGRGKFGAVLFGLVLVPIAALMSVSGRIVSRHRELAADRAAAVLTGSPARVAAALANVAEGLSRKTRKDLRAVAGRDPLHLLPVREATGLRRLWATHPPLARRVARLERMERALQDA